MRMNALGWQGAATTTVALSLLDSSIKDECGTVGAIGRLQPGQSNDVALDRTAGTYVLVCNEPGRYLSGMHASFVVN